MLRTTRLRFANKHSACRRRQAESFFFAKITMRMMIRLSETQTVRPSPELGVPVDIKVSPIGRPKHFLRTSPCVQEGDILESYDQIILESLIEILNIKLSENSWNRPSITTHCKGWLGIKASHGGCTCRVSVKLLCIR